MSDSKQRYIAFPIFMLVVTTLLSIGNSLVYVALTAAFNIYSLTLQNSIVLVLFVGSASFVAASFLGARYYNLFTRILYTLAAAWLGVLFYLFLSSLTYGLLVTLGNIIYPTLSLQYVGMALITLGIFTSIYGLVHAHTIVVKKVRVILPHLPAGWRGKTAVFVSDLHLGSLHGASFAQKVERAITTLKPTIIFIGGDLYDGTNVAATAPLAIPLKNLSAPWGVYFITGNHEEFGDNTKFIATIKSLGIRVLNDELLTVEGVQLIGVDYKNASNKEDFASILSKLSIDTTHPSILLKHEPKDVDIAQAAGVSLQLSGHTHRAQMWPLGYLPKLIYKGFNYDLQHAGATQVFTSSGVGTWGPPQRVSTNSEVVEITFVTE